MISPDLQIKPSIFETNSFLLKREPTLIEYSVFYGSIEIFNFLRMSKAEMKSSLWLYSIHGRNPEIFRHLEENKIEVDDRIYEMCLKESIKCHHNDFALYYKNNFYKEVDISSNYLQNDINYAFRFYNFEFIPNDLKEKFCFFYSVQYDYYKLVEYFKDIEGLNINETVILKIFKSNFNFIYFKLRFNNQIHQVHNIYFFNEIPNQNMH